MKEEKKKELLTYFVEKSKLMTKKWSCDNLLKTTKELGMVNTIAVVIMAVLTLFTFKSASAPFFLGGCMFFLVGWIVCVINTKRLKKECKKINMELNKIDK